MLWIKYSRGQVLQVPKVDQMLLKRTESTGEIFWSDHFKDELTTLKHED